MIVSALIGNLENWNWEFERYCAIVFIFEGKCDLRFGIEGILGLYGIRLCLGIKESGFLFKREWEGTVFLTVLTYLNTLLLSFHWIVWFVWLVVIITGTIRGKY